MELAAPRSPIHESRIDASLPFSRGVLQVMDPQDSHRGLLRARTCWFAGLACAAGLLLASATAVPAARANLITNGGFETTTSSGLGPASWTVTGDGIAIDTFFPYSGSKDAVFTATSPDPSPGTLSQMVTTTSNTQYMLSFYLLDTNANLGLGEVFTVSFGSLFTKALTTSNFVAPAYAQFSFVVPGIDIVDNSTNLSFSGLQDTTFYSVGLGPAPVFNLDDVSLTAVSPKSVPEPSSLALLATALGFGVLGLAGSAVRRR